MSTPWQLQSPLSAVCFDCDGTLSALEGINELARYNHTEEAVEVLTAQAMSQTGVNPAIYEERLAMVKPTLTQVRALAEDYHFHRAPDVEVVIEALKRLGKTLYLISAGVNPAVTLFGERLGFSVENIFAVDLNFDGQGRYLSFDPHSPLIHNQGKRQIISQLCERHSRMMHIGDGLNDLITQDLVTRFVGYGGIYYRENIASCCQFYIETPSLAAILPLSLTGEEYRLLRPAEQHVYQQGVEAIEMQRVKV